MLTSEAYEADCRECRPFINCTAGTAGRERTRGATRGGQHILRLFLTFLKIILHLENLLQIHIK